jgi:glycosyltransferase involved in cell wall biosynthesis
MKQLAIITSHPIQYNAPWFRQIAAEADFHTRVFYLWDFGVTKQMDAGFNRAIQWDIPLLSGYEYEFVPNTSRQPGTHHFWGLRNPNLVARVKSFEPDVVLIFGYNYASISNFLLRWNYKRAPVLFRGDSHRLSTDHGIREWARRRYISRVFRRLSAFLYAGTANREYFRYHGVAPERLFFAPHSVDNERFFAETDHAVDQAQRWKRELGIPERNTVILFAGKLQEEKRPADLLKAFAGAKLSNTSLLLVGAGPLEGELRQLASGTPEIYFAPFQNQTMMPRTYAAAEVFVLPSGAETWGLSVNEAMCMSKGIIASSHVGCAVDLVRPNQNGLIFPAGDVAALSQALAEAVSDRARLKLWGEESNRIIRRYNYAQATDGLREALTHLGVLSQPLPSRNCATVACA